MRFGETPVAEAAGAILAHAVKVEGATFKKGRVLSAADVAALARAGHAQIIAARLDADDVPEDAAAAQIADALVGPGVVKSAAFTGRCNLFAGAHGVVVVDVARLDRLNAVDEAITVATAPAFAAVEPRQMVATVKIIPFAAPRAAVEECCRIASESGPMVRLAEFRARRVGLIQTRLPDTKPGVLDKTVDATRSRIAALGSELVAATVTAHDRDAIAAEVARLRAQGCSPILVLGASAIVDRRDVIPSAIVASGGEIEHFGMPVDPGNLLLLGRIAETTVIGLPGCARSPKLNGFDWVLQRLLADVPVTRADLMRMGAGGLLMEIPSRPLPRAQAAPEPGPAVPRAPRIAAVVLAAGRSTRMAPANKLLADIDGRPMVARTVDAALASQAVATVVVSGHEIQRVRAALEGRKVQVCENPSFAEGLSSSVRVAIDALPAEIDGALFMLGDMPFVRPETIDRLIAAFNPLEGRAICVPTFQGKRGNPILWAARYFPEMRALGGDSGARTLLQRHADAACEVEVADEGVLRDIDTPEALAEARSGRRASA